MLRMWTFVQSSLTSLSARMEREDGAELVEYAIVIGLIALALFVVLTAFATDIGELFAKIGLKLDSAPVPVP
ncbi:MAG: Flp family type IVb pilin [Actinomycetia bacterium]|nr:Flp family type IVb pilin [Actinomycetes bacterium]